MAFAPALIPHATMRPPMKKGVIGSASTVSVFSPEDQSILRKMRRTHLAVELLGKTESRHVGGGAVLGSLRMEER